MGPLHTRTGWWLQEAGPVEPLPPLDGAVEADVVIVGGGYLGMWSAWWLTEHEPGVRVAILDAELAGHGPSGRNGGFVTALWDDLPELRQRYGDAAALDVARASSAAVHDVGAWCTAQGVDAWYRPGGHVQVASSPAQDDGWAEPVEACRELGVGEEFVALDVAAVRSRCASPVFRGGALMRDGATVQPARLGLGLRAKLLERGVAIYERSAVRRLDARPGGAVANTERGTVRARSAIVAVNAAAAGWAPLKRRLTVASSHIVLTEPVPDVLERIGWTGGECISDARTFLHYFRTTNDGRILFGWAGGHVGFGGRTHGRMEVDAVAVERTRADLVRAFPDLAGREITHAWGGPIDVSPTHLPAFGTQPGGGAHYGFGFTGNGVGPTHMGGRILAALALDRRDPETRLALVDPEPVRVPPEPFRFVGGTIIRAAYLRKERIEDRGADADAVTRFITEIPKRMGVHIGR